ncbi:hypothetical protein J6590_059222 [Homalodisca vitripennis]|nr:hypothetical protein J6590_059222 [Homalodisca vitripennis]
MAVVGINGLENTARFVHTADCCQQYQQCSKDGAHPRWLKGVRDYLDESLAQRWIGRAANDNMPLLR